MTDRRVETHTMDRDQWDGIADPDASPVYLDSERLSTVSSDGDVSRADADDAPEATAYHVESVPLADGSPARWAIYSEYDGRYIAVLADQDTAERYAGRLNAADLIHGVDNVALGALEDEARAMGRAQGVE